MCTAVFASLCRVYFIHHVATVTEQLRCVHRFFNSRFAGPEVFVCCEERVKFAWFGAPRVTPQSCSRMRVRHVLNRLVEHRLRC